MVWGPRITLSDATERCLLGGLGHLGGVSGGAPLIGLPGDVWGICKSALFEMSLTLSMRRLRDASSEIHPCPLESRSATRVPSLLY